MKNPSNYTKNTRKALRTITLYKCDDCKRMVEGVKKFKDTKVLCEMCFYRKKRGKTTRSNNAIKIHYLKWLGVI